MSRSHIPTRLRSAVIERAENRCEYCRLAQAGQAAAFHVDHIVPESADGATTLDNLALACIACLLYKAARLHFPDPKTNADVRLFHPRQDRWDEHFAWQEFAVIGLTAIGRATIAALKMNRPIMLDIRREEAYFGRHP